ncbi:MAG: phasin family protein [Alphaproteobacteria bacterium]|nr:phasin family protein [Alphaproteobacteria bacterium]
MSKTAPFPFFETDFSKIFDVTKYMDVAKLMELSPFMDMAKMGDISKMMEDYKIPKVDIEAMMAAQRKGLETIAGNNQKAYEGMQSYMRRQAEIARQSMEAASDLVQAVMAAPTPEEKVTKQIEASKTAMDNCVSSLKELSEMLSQNQLQAVQGVTEAVREGMDSLQGMMKK